MWYILPDVFVSLCKYNWALGFDMLQRSRNELDYYMDDVDVVILVCESNWTLNNLSQMLWKIKLHGEIFTMFSQPRLLLVLFIDHGPSKFACCFFYSPCIMWRKNYTLQTYTVNYNSNTHTHTKTRQCTMIIMLCVIILYYSYTHSHSDTCVTCQIAYYIIINTILTEKHIELLQL